jgi:hypothetical protein
MHTLLIWFNIMIIFSIIKQAWTGLHKPYLNLKMSIKA